MTVTTLKSPPPVPDGPGPSCAYCGRTQPPGGLEDFGVPGHAEYECGSDPAGCDQEHELRLKGWTALHYPTVGDQVWHSFRREPTGLISIWEQPEAAKALGFPNLALAAPEEPAVVFTYGEYARQDAASAAVRLVTGQLAAEILAMARERRDELPETADGGPDDPVPPSPSPVNFDAANYGHTIAGNPAHRRYTLGHLRERYGPMDAAALMARRDLESELADPGSGAGGRLILVLGSLAARRLPPAVVQLAKRAFAHFDDSSR